MTAGAPRELLRDRAAVDSALAGQRAVARANGHDEAEVRINIEDGPPPWLDDGWPDAGEGRENVGPWPDGRLDLATIIDTAPPERDWHVRDRLLAGRGHAIAGLGGSSKTRFQIQLAVGSVVGRMLWDWEIGRTGSALLILTEDTAEDVHGPIICTMRALGLNGDERAAVLERLHVFPLAGADCRLLTRGPHGVLTETARAHGLRRLCDSIKDLRFIGLDPAVAITDGDELDAVHQRRLGEFVDGLAIQTGADALLSTHARKSLASAQEVESHSSRGGGALTDAVRAEFTLRSMTSAEAAARGVAEADRPAYVQLICTKGNHIPPASKAPIWLRRSEWGVLVAATDLAEPAAKDRAKGLTTRHTDALRALWSLGNGANVLAATWRAALIAASIIRASSPIGEAEAFRRVCIALREHGLITSTGSGRSTAYAPAYTDDGRANAELGPK